MAGITCDNPGVSWLELLNSYLVKTGGQTGLLVKVVSADAEDIEPYHDCNGSPTVLDLSQITRVTTGLTDSGKPCLVLIQENP